MGYDAFISYSHAADGRLAPAIQDGLHRLAKPWNRRRALNVFRDETGLSVNPDLWESIVEALDSSRWFIVLASPEAAASPWVDREIEHFLASSEDARERLLPVVTDGLWEWDESTGTFTTSTNCVPRALATAFSSEPRHLDMSWARSEQQLHLRRADFRSAIADIAAPIHGLPKDELESEDIRIFRRSRRLRRAAVGSLALLTVGLAVAVVVAISSLFSARDAQERAENEAEIARRAEAEAVEAQAFAESETERAEAETARAVTAEQLAETNAEEATANARTARSNELAARSSIALDTEPELATLLAVQANYPGGEPIDDVPAEARDAVGVATRRLTEANARRLPGELTGYTEILTALDARVLAIVHDGRVDLASVDDERLFVVSTRDDAIVATIDVEGLNDLMISSDASLLAGTVGGFTEPAEAVVVDVASGDRAVLGRGRAIAVSATGRFVAVDATDGFAPGTPDDDEIVVYEIVEAPVVIDRISLRPVGTDYTTSIVDAAFAPTDESRLGWLQATPYVFDVIAGDLGTQVARVHSVDATRPSVLVDVSGLQESFHWQQDGFAVLASDGTLVSFDDEGAGRYESRLDVFVPGLGDADPVTSWIDSDRIVTIDDDGRLRDGPDAPAGVTVPDAFSDLAWVDDSLIVVAAESGRAVRYAPRTSPESSRLADPSGRLLFTDDTAIDRATGAVRWSTDGAFAAIDRSGGRVAEIVDGAVVVRSSDDGELVTSWPLPPTVAEGLSDAPDVWNYTRFVGDGATLLIGSSLFDAADGEPLGELGSGWWLDIDPDGTYLLELDEVRVSGEQIVRRRSLDDDRLVEIDVPFDVTTATWLPDGHVIVGGLDGEIGRLEFDPARFVPMFRPSGLRVESVTVSSSGDRLLISTSGGEFVRGELLVTTLNGEIIDRVPQGWDWTPDAVATDGGSGYWIGSPGGWRWLPDRDLAGACRLAAPVAATAFEALVGEPSVCLTRPELQR